MNVSQDLSIIELMLNASLVVKLVMLLLIVVSLMSWYWIFRKGFVPPPVLEKIVAKIPVGRLGQASEIARGVNFLCSEKDRKSVV